MAVMAVREKSKSAGVYHEIWRLTQTKREGMMERLGNGMLRLQNNVVQCSAPAIGPTCPHLLWYIPVSFTKKPPWLLQAWGIPHGELQASSATLWWIYEEGQATEGTKNEIWVKECDSLQSNEMAE